VTDERNEAGAGGLTVLVVEDEGDIRALLRAVLEAEGYRVVEASTGRDAVAVAAETRPRLILMDISLPLLDGLSATRLIKADEALRDVPVLAVSAYDSVRRRAVRAGCTDLVAKPIDLDKLKATVRRLITPPPPAATE
jgi:two-component system cell cycle response regulator DivK